jgi:tetratricopeptide (TPR) repeat protein
MTVSPATFGRKAVLLTILGAVMVMFITSFVYRMNHPNLFVQVQQQHPADDGQDHGADTGMTPPPGMGQGMGGNMEQVKEFMARVEENPNDIEALVGLGNSFLMMRAWDRAIEPLEKANQLRPDNTDVLKAIGIAYFNKENFVKAAKFYDDILVVDPNDTLAIFNLGVINKYYFEKPDQAKIYFEKVLELEKDDAEMRKLAKQELEG